MEIEIVCLSHVSAYLLRSVVAVENEVFLILTIDFDS